MELNNLSDEQLVFVIREGGQEKYREIIRRYQTKLTHYLRKFIRNPDELEDILQEVFIKAFKNLNSFEVDKSFSSWIYRIAHNEAINSLKKKENKNIDLEDVEYKIFDEKFDINEKIDQAILRQNLSVALSKLKLEYKEVLVLFYFEGLSYTEISDVLKIPTSTVGTIIKRSKEILKAELLKNNAYEK
ncbi:MAG: RNA polymerase sigma factor [Patescibacteria group bacterium]